jgi:Zn-finger nucleic acid-binding protein
VSDVALLCPACVTTTNAGPYRSADRQRRGISLQPHDYEAGVIVQRCTGCDGIWLDEGQLRSIQDAREHDYEHVRATDIVLRHRHAIPEEGQPPACPRCAETMWPSTFKTSGIRYASCIACGGMWIREGALKDIEAFWESMTRR